MALGDGWPLMVAVALIARASRVRAVAGALALAALACSIFADKYQLTHPDGPFRELLPLLSAHLWLCAEEFSTSDPDRAARAMQGYETDIAVAMKSPLLIIRTAAEALKARSRCYSF